jgi:hypothetical protein
LNVRIAEEQLAASSTSSADKPEQKKWAAGLALREARTRAGAAGGACAFRNLNPATKG